MAGTSAQDPPPTRRERRVAVALALLAGLRVLVMGLAFPFFTNVDEYRHLDVVLKYASGELPAPGPDRYEAETARLVGAFGSPEYHRDPSAREPVPPPPWRQPEAVREQRIAQMQAYLAPRYSLEADQPPVYYAVAGAWLSLGRAFGLPGLPLLYWVRLLGAAAAFASVLATWWGLRAVYPQSAFVRLGTPLLVAVVPQDALYYVTGDVFSPLLGGLGFLLALRLVRRPNAGPGAFVLAGLAVAAAFLTKYPSVAVLAACVFLCAVALRKPAGERAPGRRWLLFWLAILVPVGVWLLRNQWLGGDLTGTAFKVEKLGWGHKPFASLLDHPLFTLEGGWTFVRDMLPRFWRGELAWERQELAWPLADAVYLTTSLVFVGLAALGLRRAGRPVDARVAEAASLVAVLAGAAVLAGLSLLFVFGENTSPSADYPYFVQGRLVSGVLVPFALLFVRGVEEASSFFARRLSLAVAWGTLASVAGLALVSELVLTRPVFLSAYNALHLP